MSSLAGIQSSAVAIFVAAGLQRQAYQRAYPFLAFNHQNRFRPEAESVQMPIVNSILMGIGGVHYRPNQAHFLGWDVSPALLAEESGIV
jgi:hypothetical protein